MNSVRSRALGVAAGRGVWEGVFVCNQCTEKLTQIHAADISGAWKFTDLDALLVWLTERQMNFGQRARMYTCKNYTMGRL